MKHKNPDCGNVEIGEGKCQRCWRDTFTCDSIGHHFAENNNICDCRRTTRNADECGLEKWTDCGKHGSVKGLTCPNCEMVKLAPLTSDQVWDNAIQETKDNENKKLIDAFREKILDEIDQTPSEMYGIDEKDKIMKIIKEMI